MNSLDNIKTILDLLTLPTIIGAYIYFGRKIEVLDRLEKDMDKVKNNLTVVCNFLIKSSKDFSSSELKTFSPVQLTEIGMDFIKTLGFDKVFEEYKKDFFNFIDSENPKVKYDVEISAIKSISVLQDKDYMQFLKIYFYNNPVRNMENTSPTLGTYIRDEYLKYHPEITQ